MDSYDKAAAALEPRHGVLRAADAVVLDCGAHTHPNYPKGSLNGALARLFEDAGPGDWIRLLGYVERSEETRGRRGRRLSTPWVQRIRVAVSKISKQEGGTFEVRKRGACVTIERVL